MDMNRHFGVFLVIALSLPLAAEPVPLFDGKSLDGWEVPAAEGKFWKVREGMITGGSMEENVPLNSFLSTKKTYTDFELTFQVRLTKGVGFANSGIQVRSSRDGSAMSGYQVDAGVGYWGTIWDEQRRNKKIAVPVDEKALAAVVKDWDWNNYRILCEGPRIRTWINGVLAIDFVEQDQKIPLDGYIGLQAHAGGTFLVDFKDIKITEIAKAQKQSPLVPDDERQSFSVPEGYEVDLVSSEEQGTGKPVTVTWDSTGRMWTMTAYEYPVDANENFAQAEALYARGGKDQVLVFDKPYGPGPHKPREFTNGLVIPLGLLPTKDGAFVQYGSEIRKYTDADGDGKADSHQAILKGFGFQDSHLFAHQFEYAPGGWVYVAQGLFNKSVVERPDGKPFSNGESKVEFNQCKLARFREDGSDFELLSAGPQNIWGLGTGRDGEVFLQEANDMCIPVTEYLPGTHYITSSREKLKPYAPQIPGSFPTAVMGGTGLSGIAMAEDEGSRFAANYGGRRTFYIANPITNRIQVITMKRDEKGNPHYAKEEDFMTSTDKWFRPVAVHFGPDGAMYVVDWYNKVISHNEVPRTSPDRDKTRGRIWRIRAKGAPVPEVPNLAAMDAADLVKALDHPNARVTRLAWKELGRRGDAKVVPVLEARALDKSLALSGRLNSIWSLQEMGALTPALLVKLAGDADAHVRYEAIAAAGDMRGLSPADFNAMVSREEKDFRVRSIAAIAVHRLPKATPEMLATLVPFISLKSQGETEFDRYHTDFLRYQIRWAFEKNHDATLALLDSKEIGLEARSLAILSLPADEAALRLVSLLPTIGRSLNSEEIEILGGQLKQPAVAAAFGKMLSDPQTRESTLVSLLTFDVSLVSGKELRDAVTAAASALDPGKSDLVLELARHLRLESLAPAITDMTKSGKIPAAAGLKTLNAIGAASPEFFVTYMDNKDPDTQREALIGFSSSAGAEGIGRLAELWPELPGISRQLVIDGILSTKEGAAAFADKAADGGFEGFGSIAMERLATVLGTEHPSVRKLLTKFGDVMAKVIAMHGKPEDAVLTSINLKGPFTVETWIRLEPGIDNNDSLLGDGSGTDFNFYGEKLRLHTGGKDVVAANRSAEVNLWTHYAVTRDAAGKLRIFIDGEPDAEGSMDAATELKELNIGKAIAKGGTAASFLSFRVWSHARSEAEIRGDFKTLYVASDKADGLVLNLPTGATEPATSGTANFKMSFGIPDLRTRAMAQAIAAKFEAVREKAKLPGDTARGRALVQGTCMICHQINGEGATIGPNLSGAGAMGMDALLHNILLPNEQIESGYYRHDIKLKDGSMVSGFLSSENKDQVIIRQIGSDERVIPRPQIVSHEVSKRSLMPEGLIEGFTDQQVADLFAYLLTLK